MDDPRIWDFEKSLWTGGADRYRELVDDQCVMVLPTSPWVFSGAEAIEAVSDTPRWSEVTFSEQRVIRPEEGLIVIAYHARASRDGGEAYEAYCTSTLRRLAHEQWRVVSHQQTPPLAFRG
jgi:hypothetical protein